jgi:hypothetical protein
VIAHIVLLQPRADLSEEGRGAALDTLAHAAANVPEIRRFRLGRRVKHGLPGYEGLMTQDYEFALVIEVDDLPALTRYLKAPAHAALGHLFSTATAAALAYDYEMTDVSSPSA